MKCLLCCWCFMAPQPESPIVELKKIPAIYRRATHVNSLDLNSVADIKTVVTPPEKE